LHLTGPSCLPGRSESLALFFIIKKAAALVKLMQRQLFVAAYMNTNSGIMYSRGALTVGAEQQRQLIAAEN
jgi:hypothetical protein